MHPPFRPIRWLPLSIPGLVAGLLVYPVSLVVRHWLSPRQAAGPLLAIVSIGSAMLVSLIPGYFIRRSRWWPR
jgi:antibiotic biosynthesis monooxygenase (ABM) superfamily enzyme